MTNCVYIFGNGFDLQMGMPTSYLKFLHYYETLKASDDKVASIKKSFCSKVREEKGEYWKDLEIALGLFTKEFSDVELFKDFYRDISHALNEYLTMVEKNARPISENEKRKFWDDLEFPENYLHTDSQKDKFKEYASKGEVNADIISFNYTKTIENLLEDRIDSEFNYSDPSTSDLFRVRNIKHIHGKLNETDLLFGVNDINQVENKEFCENESFRDLIIKPKRNVELGTNIDQECISFIQATNIFYIYGTSLGPTDQYWWDLIGSRFRSTLNTVILYFDYRRQELKNNMLTIEYISLERDVRKQIMKTMGIDGEEIKYRNRIYVACNSKIFHLS